MRYSKLLIPTVKEVPAEAEIPSHKLMIRAAYIRKVASGTYTYLPLGWRSLRKIMAIIREEMDAAGAQEILLPIIQPMELWAKTGRDVVFRDIMCRFTDRHGRDNVLAPTAEEAVTFLAAGEIRSYKQLPVNLYQISQKFRDEFRPRFGVLRSREFIMKDASSFDATVEALDESYKAMYRAYRRIFDRCGLKYAVVEAESGGMGGSDTEEFMVPCDAGEDVIVATADGGYAANLERAEVDPAEPTDEVLQARRDAPAMEQVHTPGVGSIEAVCEFLGTQPAEMIKTLIYTAGEATAVALIRGDHEINEGKLARVLEAEALELAEPETIREVSGAEVGFAGPQGLLEAGKIDRLVVDYSVAAMAAGVTGANRTDYHVRNVAPGRDFPLDGEKVSVADIRNAVEGDTSGGKPLTFARGTEVGHVFKLGTKYSRAMGATFLDENGAEQPCIMGCYGIGVNRILAAAIELGHDDSGCILPATIAPFEVEVLQLGSGQQVVETAERIYADLSAAGVDVLLDDRDARPGVKFNDADLIGIPLRVVVGERGLKDGTVEVRRRTDAEPTAVAVADAASETRRMLEELMRPLRA